MIDWHMIISLYRRESERIQQGIARMVQQLWVTHVISDAWIKLNVFPAKILQIGLQM